ncbi:ABC transporter substrate-binding protein [Saccharibacillus sp. CPCC 101409]|uniref:ABC transporter substrate-binding protein n=1 Tax=Saccharibacillus sp. CPCC 101409 TaxID=3058041 RepID=UPI002673BB9C|nr:ABC transporter substrate-binding protein [Saccharibacillus sp. CPCC 101409]MDO3408954.1 ABC transporter substrate-binding protein [Saccharibacillus sp. CPCC 101409]
MKGTTKQKAGTSAVHVQASTGPKRRSKRRGSWLLPLLLLGLIAALLAGCGSGGSTAGTGAGSAEAEPSKTDAPAAAASSGEETGGETRTVSTVMGDVEIPAHPKKVAGMLYVFADHLLALGIEPHAMVTYDDLGFPEYLADRMTDTIAIGPGESPNLEALLQAQPDLILASKTMNEANYEQLSKIAPTILFDNENEGDWERFKETAAVFGMEEEADRIHAKYDAKTAEVKKELAAKAKGETVAFMRVQDKQLQLIQPADNFTLFGALGLTPASVDGIDFEGGWNVAISEEVLPDLNPDRMFIILRPGDANKLALERIQGTSIWKGLNAVRDNRVYIGDANLWFAGYGPIGLSRVIDEVEAAFANGS